MRGPGIAAREAVRPVSGLSDRRSLAVSAAADGAGRGISPGSRSRVQLYQRQFEPVIRRLEGERIRTHGRVIPPWTPDRFVDPFIGITPVPNREQAADPVLHLVASLFRDGDPELVVSRIREMGGEIEARAGVFIYISMDIHLLRERLDRLTGLPIRALSERGIVLAADEEASSTVQLGEWYGGRRPYTEAGIDGSTQIVGITDTGLSLDATVLADGIPGDPGSAVAAGAGPDHRKVVAYLRARDLPDNGIGGGDLLSCDGTAGGSHGHLVASLAAGNASELLHDIRGLDGFDTERDGAQTAHAVDGVAPGARIYFIDDQTVDLCAGGQALELQEPGSFTANLEAVRNFAVNNADALGQRLAIHDLSMSILGSQASYTVEAQEIDAFLADNQEFLVVAAAGNRGIDSLGDGNLDFGTITSPGTAKNVLTVGASGYPNNALDVNESVIPETENDGVELLPRDEVSRNASSQGPAAFTVDSRGATNWRIKPDVMGPGGEILDNQRLFGPITCVSGDDDQDGPVECSRPVPGAFWGTSFSAASVAGAAALVRDYFQKGFAPAGLPGGVPQVLSGPELKAALIASTEVMTGNPYWRSLGGRLRLQFYSPRHPSRFTPEQGYGRVTLSRLLPLSGEPDTPSFVHTEIVPIPLGGSTTREITVLDPEQELRMVVSWYDAESDQAGAGEKGKLVRDVQVDVTDCGADGTCETDDDIFYPANFFSEDTNYDGVLLDLNDLFACSNDPLIECDPGAFNPVLDCGWDEATCDLISPATSEDCNHNGFLDRSHFSMAVDPDTVAGNCTGGARDENNNNRAFFLSPDPDGDGDPADTQLFQGRTLRLGFRWASTDEVLPPGNLEVGLVVTGGFSGPVQGNAIRLDKAEYTCSDLLSISILDGGVDATEAGVSSGVAIVSRSATGEVLDTETALVFTDSGGDPATPGFKFSGAPMAASAHFPPAEHDGLLTVEDGGRLEAIYVDTVTSPQPADAVAWAAVRCRPALDLLHITRRGTNARFDIQGGCDRRDRIDPRGIIFGLVPGTGLSRTGDLFLDAGEDLVYSVAILNKDENRTFRKMTAILTACVAGTIEADMSCVESGDVRILDPVQQIGPLTPGQEQNASFNLQIDSGATFPGQVDMIARIQADDEGMTAGHSTVFHHLLNADQFDDPAVGHDVDGVFRYSTDFPTGGREIRVNAGELFDPMNPELAAETYLFDNAVVTGPGLLGNSTLLAFNPVTGRFDEPAANNWPWTFDLDDERFGVRRRFDSDAGDNLELADRPVWQWSNTGECGFQSNAPDPFQMDGQGGTGGIWHTGHALSQDGTPPGRSGYDLGCENYDVPGSHNPKRESVLDALSSPIFQRVHVGPDTNGFTYTVAFTRLAMNVQVDVGDGNAVFALELDPDADSPQPVDPLDLGWLASDQGTAGFLNGVSTYPYRVFNPNNPHETGSAQALGQSLDAAGPGQNISAIHGPGSAGSFFDPNNPNKAGGSFRSYGDVTGIWTGRGFGTPQRRGAAGLPLRNHEELLDGIGGGGLTFEDIYGPNELRDPGQTYPISAVNPEFLAARRDRFQVNLIALLRENRDPSVATLSSYGWGLDDVVVEWTESHPVADRTPCGDPSTWHPDGDGGLSVAPELAGGCASISWDRRTITEPETALVLTVVDRNAQYGPDGMDQAFDAAANDDQADDTDEDSLAELEVRVVTDSDLRGEMVRLIQTSPLSPIYRAAVTVSASHGLASDTDGVIFIQENGDGSAPVAISAFYDDADINVAGAGTALPCPDNPLVAVAFTEFETADVMIVTARITDEGPNADGDGLPDDGETVRLDLLLINQMNLRSSTQYFGRYYYYYYYRSRYFVPTDVEDVTITLTSTDPDVACILDGTSYYGTLPYGEPVFNPSDDPFRIVIGNAGRVSAEQILQADLKIGIQARYVDDFGREHRVAGFATPQRFALKLDLDMMSNGGAATPLHSDTACVGGTAAGRACQSDADCPGEVQPGLPATCQAIPEYLRAGGESAIAGAVGFFEGFEGAENMAGRNFTAGAWPHAIPGTSFVHSPAINEAGGYMDGGTLGNWLDFQPGPLATGATPGNVADDPEGSSAVDGSRCQYNDPRGPSKHPRSEQACRPWVGSDWHVYDHKAFTGGKALRYGINGVEDLDLDDSYDAYHLQALAAAFSGTMHVGSGGGAILSIQHIIQMADDRTFGVPYGNAADRGHIEAQEIDPQTGEALRGWIKVNGFRNDYDSTGVTPYFGNCVFDSYDEFYDAAAALGNTPGFDPEATSPVGVRYNADDVGSEDDYFDPNDPQRFLGPSGGCFPAYVFASMGDYTSIDPTHSGDAQTDGALGSTGTGVWVNSLFSLDQFAGRTIRLRFVATGLELALGYTWADFFGNSIGNGTRGWVIDDLAVSGLVDRPMVLVPDLRVPGPSACPVDPDPSTPVNEAACIQAVAMAGEDVTHDVPGTEVMLDGGVSWTDACVDGMVEYRWRIGGVTVQEYSNNPVLFVSPADTTLYTLDVRCSTQPACLDSDSVLVELIDPGEVSGTPGTLGTVLSDPEALSGGRDDGRGTRRRIRPRGHFPDEQVVRVDWAEGGESAQVFVLGVKLRRRGVELRAGAGEDPAARIQQAVCRLDEATPSGDGRVEIVESDIALEPGEIFGYLAQARTGRPGFPARSGSLGQGESPGEAPAFARGAGDPLSRLICLP